MKVVLASLNALVIVQLHILHADSDVMRIPQAIRTFLLTCVVVLPMPVDGLAQPKADATVPGERDGQHDFDFELGSWKTHVSRRLRPLTGSTTWVEMEGTTVVRKVWNGRANLVELEVDYPGGHLQGLSLRLYNPQSRQWSLNFSNSNDGILTPPTIGQFRDGRGEFFGAETLNGRAIFVRFVITPLTPNSIRFEQAFSDDGGKSWEVNWIATDTRIEEKNDPAPAPHS